MRPRRPFLLALGTLVAIAFITPGLLPTLTGTGWTSSSVSAERLGISPEPTPTATPARYTVSGVVCEFPLPFCGAMRGVTVTLLPLARETTTSLVDGSFALFNVPNGTYSIVVSPSCNPFGCYEPTPVTVADADVNVLVAPAALTPTPMATATETPTVMPTAFGDVNCDRTVTSIDAALILQYGAGLLGSLDCHGNADVNEDGVVNAIDAALILQHVAGLIGTMPP